MAKSPAEMEAAILKNIPAKTGKTLEQWVAIIKKEGPKDAKELRNWLKEEKGLGHGQAGILGGYYRNGGKTTYGDTDNLLENQYTEEKAEFRKVYDKLVKEIRKLDKDIQFEPCRTYVSIIGKHQFAIAQPTKTELRLGLALSTDTPENDLLKKAKNLGSDKVTHYVSLKTKDDVKYATGFIKVAYLRDRQARVDKKKK